MNKQPYIAESLAVLEQAHIILTEAEKQHIEIAHFNLPDYPRSGLQLLTYCNSPLYCAKELVLFADQTCPEHRHPPYKDRPGKQETFRCRWGEVYLFVDDPALTLNQDAQGNPVCRPPQGDEEWYTCDRFILLRLESSTPSCRIPATGLKPGRRARWCRSSPQKTPMNTTFLPIRG